MAASVFIGDPTVSRTTTFNFQLFLNTFTVASGDYLLFVLPITDVTWATGTLTTCKATSMTAACSRVDSSTVKIILTGVGSNVQSIEGAVSNFINPDSVRAVSNI